VSRVRWTNELVTGELKWMLSDTNPHPAREQFDAAYFHGGGFTPMKGWTYDPLDYGITYPGDEKLLPVAWTELRSERIYLYRHAWVAIVQPDDSFVVARMD
jgi:hypothetical protein